MIERSWWGYGILCLRPRRSGIPHIAISPQKVCGKFTKEPLNDDLKNLKGVTLIISR
jgi:hypothetical protein